MWYMVVILEEGNFTYPYYPRCNTLVLWKALNGCHPSTALCTRGDSRNHRRLPAEETLAGSEKLFQAYGRPLTNIISLKYLGRIPVATGDYWLVVVTNL